MDSEVFDARVRDTARLCDLSAAPKLLGFLSPFEAAAADRLLKNGYVRYAFFGGYDGAERVLLACLPDWCEEPELPITAVAFKYREQDKLSHRDVLGALMGLGLTREAVGDILIEPGRAVAFLKSEVADFVLSQIDKIGRVGVTAEKGASGSLPPPGRLVSCRATVSSLRLDCVVAALCDTSRAKSAELIANGSVSVNSICCDRLTRSVASGDRVAVRGKGRFNIISAEEHSRKGRIILEYGKFI